jgi:predicted Ser/Thr protein kinase
LIGTRVNNRYQIDGELGQGGMGTVYKGFDSTLERDVAIKMMTETRLGTEGRNRLLHEAKAIAKLSHLNIITVFDAGEFEQSPYIVMEYVEGVNLYDEPPKDIEEIILIMKQVCAALSHAHEHGIIHRDLKPENVILTPNGTVKLMDFGLARSLSSRLTSEGTILGTVFYLAPEQAQGHAVDPRSDLYSLGVMMYELVTGELPFLADDPLAVVSQHIHAPVVPPRAKNANIPPALEVLILQLMRKDPAERPACAQEVFNQLSLPEMLDVEALPAEELSVLDRIVRGRLVGREQELKQALQAWQKAMASQGQLLLVSGEPGVGKTRLMREVVTHAEVSGGQTFIGESQAEGNAPYAAFAQIIRRALRSHQNNGLELPDLVMAELISIAPELRVDYPEIAPNPALEPESEQRRLFECVFRFFSAVCAGKSLLLVLEDIHWADSGTLSLLQFLARRCREHPVMLLGTYREVELDDALPFHQTLLDLNRKNLGTRLKLERLDQNKTRDMLGVIFAEEIKSDFLAGIFQETEGNPFFIEEVCKALIESGQVYFDGEIWQRPPDMADIEIPQSIKVAVQSRVIKLSESAQDILLNAAVIGREFGFELLQKVTGKEEDDLIEGLEAGLKAQLIEEVKVGSEEIFSFSHALIPTALRDSLSGMRRTRLHCKIAQVMDVIMPDAYQRLAYHWREGGESRQSLGLHYQSSGNGKENLC